MAVRGGNTTGSAKDVAATIAEQVRPFSEIWTDDRGGIVAFPAGEQADCALVVRADGAPTVFRTRSGKPAAVVGRGWAMVGRRAVQGTAWDDSTVGFAGAVKRREIPDIVAAFRGFGARKVVIGGKVSANFLEGLFGSGTCVRLGRPHPLARALMRAVGRAVAAFWPRIPSQGWCEEADIAAVERNAGLVGEWGIPPPGEGSALHAYARAVVSPCVWEPLTPGAVPGTRGEMVEALRRWSARFLSYPAVVAADGSQWRLHFLPLTVMPRSWSIHGIGFPMPEPSDDPTYEDPGLRVAPQRDIAVLTRKSTLGRAFLARGAEPLVYGTLAHEIGNRDRSKVPPEWIALAATLACADVRREGATLVLDGVFVPQAYLRGFFPRRA